VREKRNLDTRLAKPIAIPPGDAMRKVAIAEKIRSSSSSSSSPPLFSN
jgi:hypothetical protein